ncbi:saccharopine dehydrogenase NADP-binding domain-containing protein [Micromonospora andamanensis]|uniref:saccharopine dehydrogenase NADP-binding domain-containing protein n=1 Tax=Micromonospora andamanensis TaxID=1287068 RepID=UPI001952339B|nr:saccharopine dehydrogenase NADP-binding domain-containing protein [Micromonospora andamanensis]GIJ42517.1 saccharopine dehydrogenase [Micromonospora andamanensis]
MTPRIGLLGGYGSVGAEVAARLRKHGLGELVIAGRDRAAGRRLITERLGGAGDFVAVDLGHDDALASFCARCTVVVNCAGPSRRILDRVATVARRNGAHYVDVGGDDPVHARLTTGSGWCAVLSAGMIPGLTGLLPRYLARGFDTVEQLTFYHGVRDSIGPAAAYDFVAGILDGDDVPSAAWRDGPRPGAARRQTELRLPHFPDPVTAQPYLSPEASRTATALGIRSGTWYSVFDGERLPVVLQQVPRTTATQIRETAEKVRRAAEFDVLGRTPQVTLLCQLDGQLHGRQVTRSLIVRADRAAALVAAAAVPAITAVAANRVAPGVHFAADVLPPAEVVGFLAADPAVVQLSEHDSPLDDLVTPDEGAI